MDDEAVTLGLGFLADIAVHTRRIVELLEDDEAKKKRKKTDFTDLDERVRRAREYIARKEEELRQKRAREAGQQPRD